METVGEATWEHSVKCLKSGGTIVISGSHERPESTGSIDPDLLQATVGRRLNHGNPRDLRNLIALCSIADIRPTVQQEFALADARDAFAL